MKIQNFSNQRFCLIQLAEEHVIVGLIDQKLNILGLFFLDAREPNRGFFVVTEQIMCRTDQIEDDPVSRQAVVYNMPMLRLFAQQRESGSHP